MPEHGRSRSPMRRGIAVGIMALAASLLLAFYPTLQRGLHADFMTSTAELRRVTLDDGSTVDLGPNSAIAVRYSAYAREIELLGGEVFFDVEKNPARPFRVYASGIKTTVTGTAFAVRDSAGEVEVALRSGAVEVTLADGTVETLAPGDRVVAAQGAAHFTRDRIDPAEIASWRDNRLMVHRATLASVIDTLDRYHSGMILLSDASLGQRRVTGSFDLKHPVDALRAAVGAQKGEVTVMTPYLLVVSGR